MKAATRVIGRMLYRMAVARLRWICGGKVYSGPFEGVSYAGLAHYSSGMPKLIGTYEKELHSIFREILRDPPELIVDVGSAEGFYAVALARRCPKAKVVAFEMDELARRLAEEMACLNTRIAHLRLWRNWCQTVPGRDFFSWTSRVRSGNSWVTECRDY
ncbi:MAG: hypothetical protein SNJ52_03160 [Verrucomicrobiia bacterium]